MADAHLDFETGCGAELTGPRAVGVHKYVEYETFRVWLFSWRIGNVGPVNRYSIGAPDPVDLLNHIRNGGIVVSHNAMFERVVWAAMRERYGLHHWPELKAEQQVDTMAVAMSLNLPASLDALASALRLTQQKDDEGKKLMLSLAKPKKTRDGQVFFDWTDEKLSRLGDYCDQDVRTETEVDTRISRLPPDEQAVWVLDQIINDRGIPIDLPAAMRAVDLTEYAKLRANARIKELTGGAVSKYTEIAKIVKWINDQGVQCDSFTRSDHDSLLIMSDLNDKPQVRSIIELRKGAGKTSTAKFTKMVECCCADNRTRGQYQYHGATQTGRWAGRLVQFQNLYRLDWERDEADVRYTLNYLTAPIPLEEAYDMLAMYKGEDQVLTLIAKCARAMVVAEEGYILYGADFSNIEGRINAWLAGEAWKVQAFIDYDSGVGQDLYKLAYAKAFGVDVSTVGKGPQRQIGKVQELALGYQGGVGAYINMGANYNVQPYQLVEPVKKATPPEQWEKVCAEYKGATDKNGLPLDQWTAIKIIVRGWRASHPRIVQSWYDLENAAVEAVDQPHTFVPVYNGRAHYMSDGNYLYCRLPSGRVICYPQPRIKQQRVERVRVEGAWRNCDEFFDFELKELKRQGFEFWTSVRNVVWFTGIDAETKRQTEAYLYGGHQCENIVQATAADCQRYAVKNIEEAGYPVIMHTHDEVVAHTPDWYGSQHDFESIMRRKADWMEGLPLAVSGFTERRYVK